MGFELFWIILEIIQKNKDRGFMRMIDFGKLDEQGKVKIWSYKLVNLIRIFLK